MLRGGNWPGEYAETIVRAAALEFGPITLLTYRVDGHLMSFPGREGSDDLVFLVWTGGHFEAAVRQRLASEIPGLPPDPEPLAAAPARCRERASSGAGGCLGSHGKE